MYEEDYKNMFRLAGIKLNILQMMSVGIHIGHTFK
jgi:hypothetical protein